jgi:polar amino acid transport system permease protein
MAVTLAGLMAIDIVGELEFIWRILPELGKGLVTTLELTALALTAGLVLAVPTAVVRTYTRGPLNWLFTAYVEVFRGTPLLVQLFVVYYGLPEMGIVFDRFFSAWAALTLNSAAYQSEYIRGAIMSVSEGQLTAARSLGMRPLQAFRWVVLPQALRLALPAWSNEVAYMVKYVSVVYMIALPELFTRGAMIRSRTFKVWSPMISVAVIYLGVVIGITRVMDYVEKRFRIPGLESGHGGREY